MAKTQKIVKVFGILEDGTRATTQQADQVYAFVDVLEDPKFIVMPDHYRAFVGLKTDKGSYIINKSKTIENLFQGVCAGNKIHITLKRLVGKVIYWS